MLSSGLRLVERGDLGELGLGETLPVLFDRHRVQRVAGPLDPSLQLVTTNKGGTGLLPPLGVT
jgi:hypothetical protein